MKMKMEMGYEKSVSLALKLGFKRIYDDSAFKGEYFIKDDKIWIHWIEKLMYKLGVSEIEELISHKYDVDSYYKYRKYTNEMADIEIQQLQNSINNPESVLSGKDEILNDTQLLKSIIALQQEGFDDEILEDFRHQMSKR